MKDGSPSPFPHRIKKNRIQSLFVFIIQSTNQTNHTIPLTLAALTSFILRSLFVLFLCYSNSNNNNNWHLFQLSNSPTLKNRIGIGNPSVMVESGSNLFGCFYFVCGLSFRPLVVHPVSRGEYYIVNRKWMD